MSHTLLVIAFWTMVIVDVLVLLVGLHGAIAANMIEDRALRLFTNAAHGFGTAWIFALAWRSL